VLFIQLQLIHLNKRHFQLHQNLLASSRTTLSFWRDNIL